MIYWVWPACIVEWLIDRGIGYGKTTFFKC